jgi:hypothetical protein
MFRSVVDASGNLHRPAEGEQVSEIAFEHCPDGLGKSFVRLSMEFLIRGNHYHAFIRVFKVGFSRAFKKLPGYRQSPLNFLGSTSPGPYDALNGQSVPSAFSSHTNLQI